MKRSGLLSLAGLVVVFSLACASIGGGGGGASTSGVDIEIVNRSPDDVCYVFISPTESDAWGNDLLGENDRIAPGDRKTFSMDDNTYDVRAETCDEAAMLSGWEISSDTTLTVGESRATVRLLMSNESSTEVCYVFISPSSGDDWGEDWMGQNETVQAGQLRVFYVAPDTYDLQAADCEGNPVTEEYDVDLSDDLTWTLND